LANLIVTLITYYGYAIFARIILSWFPISPGGAMATVFSFLYNITEPVLGPLRRVIPPLGGFDLSPIVAFIALEIVAGAIRGA
jgi:YggT family protein